MATVPVSIILEPLGEGLTWRYFIPASYMQEYQLGAVDDSNLFVGEALDFQLTLLVQSGNSATFWMGEGEPDPLQAISWGADPDNHVPPEGFDVVGDASSITIVNQHQINATYPMRIWVIYDGTIKVSPDPTIINVEIPPGQVKAGQALDIVYLSATAVANAA